MPDLHPQAAKSFDEAATRLLSSITPRPQRPPTKEGSSDVHVSANLGSADIHAESIREFLVDYSGNKRACYFDAGEKGVVGLEGRGHDDLVHLAQRISSRTELSAHVSLDFVYSTIIDWLQVSVKQPGQTLTQFLAKAVTDAVIEHEVWLPIPVVSIPHPIQLGPVVFRRITKTMMDQYITSMKADATPRTQFAIEQKRKHLQAMTAACVKVNAESIRASEIAVMQAEEPIALFRFACPALLSAEKWAPIDPSLIDGLGASTYVSVKDGQISGVQSHVPGNRLMQWTITKEEAAGNLQSFWRAGNTLLTANRNQFQDLLLTSLVQYSKSVLKPDVSERLVYVVSSLEALLINQGEPIVQNLRERLAMLQENEADRRASIDLVTRVYELRSRFVHGALPASDMEMLNRFFLEIWAAFYFILANHDKWKSKSDFLSYIDTYKLRGPPIDTSDRLPSYFPANFSAKWTQRL